MSIHSAAPITQYDYDTPLSIGVIPDTHWCPTDRVNSLKVAKALGNFYKKQNPDIIVHIGDANDFGSMSSYDKGQVSIEGKRLFEEMAFAEECLDTFHKALGSYDGDLFHTIGNHAQRIDRHQAENPELKGSFGNDYESFIAYGWEQLPFLHVLKINGVCFSHYFQNPVSVMGSPIGGAIETAIKNLGTSFVQGHVQTFRHGMLPTGAGDFRVGTIAGACYIADHGYKGPQGNRHWRGTLLMHNVDNGYYDLQPTGLKALLRDYL